MWVDLTTFDDYYDFMEFCQLLHVDEEDPEFMYQDYENFPADYYSESCLDEFEFDKIIEFAEMDEDDKKIFEGCPSANSALRRRTTTAPLCAPMT